MTQRTHGILALAASALLGAGVLVAADRDPAAGQGQTTTGQNTTAQPGQGQAQAGQSGQQGDQSGQQVDQAVLQQLRQFAQEPQTAPDKLFLLNTAIGSMWEIQLSQQAQQKGQSDQVKQLAQHIVQDHQQMNQRLQQTAQQLGVQIPQSLPQMKQEEVRIFAALSGKEFDQHYIANMNASHAKDVACFQAASSMSQNAQVKQFATETLPKLQQHRQMVHQSATALGIMLHGSDEATPAGGHIRGTGTGADQGQGTTTPRTGNGAGTGGGSGTGSGTGGSGAGGAGGTGAGGSGAGSTGSGTGSGSGGSGTSK